MKRKKSEIAYWDTRIISMFQDKPESRLIKHRYHALRYLLMQQHAGLDTFSKEKLIEILKDVLYLDRILRRETQGTEDAVKEALADEKQIELGYMPETVQYHE